MKAFQKMNIDKDCTDIRVTIAHPMGYIETSLEMWMQNGPGERRYIAPVRVICADDGRPLPLSVIPLRYRNNGLSRLLIRIGVLENPWPEE